MATMTKQTFDATLVRPPGVGTWTYLNVPFNVADEFGTKGQLKVKGSVNGVPFRGSLLPQGDGRHYLVVKSENELAAIPNFGKKSIEEVKETLAAHGLTLRGDE